MRNVVVLFFAALLLVFTGMAWAQTETGQITGTITDASGGVVSGAKVTAKSVSTGATRETTTNSAGIYTIASLRADSYEVTVEATGFRKLTERVQVAVGSTNEISAKLEVGIASQVVEVVASAEAITVHTEDQTLSQVITSEQLNNLPTDPTRNPYALVATAGNVTEDCNSTRGAAPTGGCGYAINGLRSASTNILLDGGENVDAFTASVGQTIPLDSVQEFSVLTNDFTAEFGRASGGVVNLVTKSGSNTFHGSGYEFNRVSHLSANTFQNDSTGTPKGVFTRNNFGFSVGGPVKKNKLFFFDNTEWLRVRSSAPQQLTILDSASIPLLAPASQAFFTAFGKLAPGVTTLKTGSCGGTAGTPGAPLTCDQVSFNVPSDAGGGNPQNSTLGVARIDYNYSDKTTISGRYAFFKELDFPGVVNSSPYVGYNTGQTNYDQNYLFSLTHVFSPNFVNTAKVVYNRINGPIQPLGSAPIGPTLFAAGTTPSVLGTPLVFPGYNETTPGAAIPFGGPQNLYQFYNDITYTHGKHTLKFGGSYVHIRDNRVFGAYETAVEQLGTNLGTGLTNLANGAIFTWQDAIFPQGKFPCVRDINTGAPMVTPACTVTLPVGHPAFNRNFHYNDGAAYGQDSWRIMPRLTLNVGVRWEFYGVQHNANPALDSNFVLGPGTTFFNQIRNGAVELAQNGGVFGHDHYGNFGPRIGFAWDPFGGGKTSVRGGYGIGYERNFGNVTFNAIQNPPNYAVISLQNSSAAGANNKGDVTFLPVFTDNSGPLGGSTGSKALPPVSQRAIDQNIKTAYAETWDFAIERQITPHSLVSVDYAGSHGVHLYDIANINPAGSGAAYLGDARGANRINLQYSNQNFRSDHAYSRYSGVTVQYKTNNLWNKGVNLNANYTYSHALDNLSSTFTDSELGTASGAYYLGYLDAFNPKLNFGNADFDIRHRFVLSGSWVVPWMKTSNNAIARTVLGGWGLGSVIKWRSGAPFSIFDCSNPGGTNCPEWVPSGSVARTGSAVNAGSNFAPNTFNYITLPNTGGAVNNVGDAQGIPICSGLFHTGCVYSAGGFSYPERNNYFGPGYWNVDMNFFKDFKITERFGLQFRAEMYNIFNHHNQFVNLTNLDASSLVDNNGNSTPFIQTEKGGPSGFAGTSADERRNIQLGLKLTF
ncbi:MAG TPA: carboxypeptidase regulatory-like domain-containing protein [Candidatus Acidoferrum sp.]|nr:carboxypeptidase regulatory-like domain-containing protein [Candidatus Acidoferrum sp.]